MPIISNCTICGKEIKHKPSASPKFCSKECKNLSQKGRRQYKIDFDTEEMKRLYLEEKLSLEEIAKMMGTYKKMIRSRLSDMGVSFRTSGESKSIYLKRNKDKNPFARKDVIEKIKPTLSDPKNIAARQEGIKNFFENLSEEKRKKWNENISKAWASFSKKKKIEIMEKQYQTKLENGTLSQSIAEKDLIKFIQGLGIKDVQERVYFPETKELDIYIPSYNFAIEFDGTYWHSELNGKNKTFHNNKTNNSANKNIHLIHIFEDEWRLKKEIVESIVKGKLGFNEKLYARKCTIKKVESKEAKIFFDNNHIQGHTSAKVYIGLYYEDELKCCISLGKSRFNKNYDWEILRFANKLNISVIGGFSRLLKHFRKEHSGSIVTYADRRYFDGKVYESAGFKFSHTTEPNYYYTDHRFRYNRQKFQKHKLEKQLEYFNEELTEWENMQLNGWDRIWDCGNNVYSLE